jgi:TRAP-type uncharacterized transport system substrate-binding protein
MQGLSVFLFGFLFASAQVCAGTPTAVTLLAGESNWLVKAQALAQIVEHENDLRVLPMQSSGCVQAAADLMQLPQVDAALLTTDCIAYAEEQGLLPKALSKLSYVARLETLPIIIVTRREVATLTALAGKRIATGAVQSSGFVAGEMLFAQIELPFMRVAKSGLAALEALKNNEADAALLVGGVESLAALDPKLYHVLGFTAPISNATAFQPVLLPATDFGRLADGDVETVATTLAIVAVNSADKPRIKALADTLFSNTELRSTMPQMALDIAGWKRHASAARAAKNIQPNRPTEQGDGT